MSALLAALPGVVVSFAFCAVRSSSAVSQPSPISDKQPVSVCSEVTFLQLLEALC